MQLELQEEEQDEPQRNTNGGLSEPVVFPCPSKTFPPGIIIVLALANRLFITTTCQCNSGIFLINGSCDIIGNFLLQRFQKLLLMNKYVIIIKIHFLIVVWLLVIVIKFLKYMLN